MIKISKKLGQKLNRFSSELRELFAWFYEKNYITARDGNACLKLSPTLYAVTRSGIRKHKMDGDCLTLVNQKGVDLINHKPSIEAIGHIMALKASGKRVSVHVHSPNTVAFFSSQLVNHGNVKWPELDRYTGISMIGYSEPGSAELHRAINLEFKNVKTDIVVLQNHGVIAVGDSLEECQEHIHRLEHSCEIWLKMESLM